jgi:lysophospholipase L1-like esterase
MAYTFDQIFAADPANPANIAQNASIKIFAPGDATKTAIAITDTSGTPLPNPIPVNANGFGPAFSASIDRVAWEGGGFTGFFTSYEGMKQVALDAQTAAETAAATAGAEAAAVADAAIGDATAASTAAAASAATAASNASASATAAANAAALVGAPADTAIAAAVNNGASATKAALNATYVPKWKANTAYVAGEKVLSPNGDVVSAKTGFTSGASYSAANWDLSTSYATPASVTTLTKPLAARLPGNRAVFLGDSNTFGYNQQGENYPDAACLYSGGNLIKVKNAGVSGQTIAQIAARVQTDVIDTGANICFVMAGTNDLPSDTVDLEPLKTAYRNDIIEKLRAAGVTPILCSILPGEWSTARKSKIVQFNLWINRQAQVLGIPYVNFYKELVDPATGNWLSTYAVSPTSDAYHPNAAAYRRMGKIAYDTIAPWLPPAPAPLVANNIETTNKHYNGCFIIDSNADSMPDGNVAIGTSAGLNYALEDAAGYVGKAWRLTITNGTGDLSRGIQSPSTGHVAGNRIAVAAKVDIASADLPAGCGFIMDLAWNNGTTETVFKTGVQVTGGVAYVEAVVPAGATSVDVRRYFKVAASRTDTFKLGQITVRDLTALNTLN